MNHLLEISGERAVRISERITASTGYPFDLELCRSSSTDERNAKLIVEGYANLGESHVRTTVYMAEDDEVLFWRFLRDDLYIQAEPTGDILYLDGDIRIADLLCPIDGINSYLVRDTLHGGWRVFVASGQIDSRGRRIHGIELFHCGYNQENPGLVWQQINPIMLGHQHILAIMEQKYYDNPTLRDALLPVSRGADPEHMGIALAGHGGFFKLCYQCVSHPYNYGFLYESGNAVGMITVIPDLGAHHIYVCKNSLGKVIGINIDLN